MDRKLTVFAATGISAAAVGVLFKAAGAPPNIESLMPFILATSMVLGPAYGLVNAVLVRSLYDAYMSWAGWWTVMTAGSYGVVGLCGGLAARYKRSWSRIELALFAAVLTIVYDILTMLVFGFVLGIPFPALVVGQVPFTINHLLGNVVLCFIFAPMLLKALRGYVEEPVRTRLVVAAPAPTKQER